MTVASAAVSIGQLVDGVVIQLTRHLQPLGVLKRLNRRAGLGTHLTVHLAWVESEIEQPRLGSAYSLVLGLRHRIEITDENCLRHLVDRYFRLLDVDRELLFQHAIAVKGSLPLPSTRLEGVGNLMRKSRLGRLIMIL